MATEIRAGPATGTGSGSSGGAAGRNPAAWGSALTSTGFSTPVGHIWAQAGSWPPQPLQRLVTPGMPWASSSRPGQIRHRLHCLQSAGSTATRWVLGLILRRQAPSRMTSVVKAPCPAAESAALRASRRPLRS